MSNKIFLYQVKILCQVVPNFISSLNILLNPTNFGIKSFFNMPTGRVFIRLYFYTSICEKDNVGYYDNMGVLQSLSDILLC